MQVGHRNRIAAAEAGHHRLDRHLILLTDAVQAGAEGRIDLAAPATRAVRLGGLSTDRSAALIAIHHSQRGPARGLDSRRGGGVAQPNLFTNIVGRGHRNPHRPHINGYQCVPYSSN